MATVGMRLASLRAVAAAAAEGKNIESMEKSAQVPSAVSTPGSVSPALCPCNLSVAGDTVTLLKKFFYCRTK